MTSKNGIQSAIAATPAEAAVAAAPGSGEGWCGLVRLEDRFESERPISRKLGGVALAGPV